MILELDAGNTRVKWRFVSENRVTAQGASTAENSADSVAALIDQLGSQAISGIQRIRVSSVRGKEFKAELSRLAHETWKLVPEFARVTSQAAGVTNAYSDPATMGIDRWLALLAAYNSANCSFCVLDCGSAITFDWVNDSGKHQGGYIVPGMKLMEQSLANKARVLAIQLPDQAELTPGSSTGEAIGNGIATMVAGFAAMCLQQLVQAGEGKTRWYLTGGDADIVSAHIPWEHEVVSELVLDGLQYALP